MEARMTELNINEILKYLGHRGQEITPDVEQQIRRCMERILRAAQPRLVYRSLPVESGQVPGLPLEGDDMRKILAPCSRSILMAATLGARVEQLLMRSEVLNMAEALIMDACASTAIENVCDNFEADMREQLEGKDLYLTDRFSPGYGDLPLHTQRTLCEVLNTGRRIGLTVTENYIMIPRKSVTAIMGIADTPQPRRRRGCEVCSLFRSCAYRRKGTVCHE